MIIYLFFKRIGMLQVKSLSFDYYDKPLLESINFSVFEGQLLHLRGPNGAGKTTLLRLLAGLLQATSGGVFWHDQLIDDALITYQKNLCFVGFQTGLSPQLTIRENCKLDNHWQQSDVFLDDLLRQFSLQAIADIPCHHLSTGLARRAALLRIAYSRAKIWLLDEPFAALDAAALTVLANFIKQHIEMRGTVILTSHQDLPLQLDNYQVYTL